MYKLFLKVFKYILKKINKIPFVYKTREGEREKNYLVPTPTVWSEKY